MKMGEMGEMGWVGLVAASLLLDCLQYINVRR